MLDSPVLAVVVGLVFVYFVFSMIVSKINDFVSNKLGWRARDLETWLRKTLDPKEGPKSDVVSSARLQESSLIRSVTRDAVLNKPTGVLKFVGSIKAAAVPPRLPSFIAPRTFSLAVLDILLPGDGQVTTIGQVTTALEKLPSGHPAKAPLTRLAIEAGQDLVKFRAGVEGWYDDSMTRVSAWYKRRVQRWLLIYSVVIVGVWNVDSIVIARSLWSQDTVRDAVVAQAAKTTAPNASATASEAEGSDFNDVSSRVAQVRRLNLPIGWAAERIPATTTTVLGKPTVPNPETVPTRATVPNPDLRRWPGLSLDLLIKLLGLTITVGALSQGAPFWFDLLNKISKLRSARSSSDPSPSDQPLVVVHQAAPQ